MVTVGDSGSFRGQDTLYGSESPGAVLEANSGTSDSPLSLSLSVPGKPHLLLLYRAKCLIPFLFSADSFSYFVTVTGTEQSKL